MRQFLSDLVRQLKGIWARLDGAQRLVVVAVLAAATVGLIATVWFAGRPSYQEVLAATAPEELRDARRLLGQAGIPYVTDDGGQSILVERSRVAMANAILFEGGLRSGTGLRGSDSVTGILADSATRADILDTKARVRAEEAIRQLEGVVAATVTSTRPPRSPFRDRDQRPRATAVVRLRAGVAFEPLAKAAASQLASAVGVPFENVEVVNAATHVRWSFDPERGEAAGSGEFLSQQRSMSEARTRAAQEALDAVYPGKTIVTVNVELDPEWEIVSSKVLPTEPIVRTDRITKDSTDSGSGGGGGAAASGDASASAPADAAASGNRNTTRKETRDREFLTEIGERRQGRLAPPVKRMSVALLYDRGLEQKEGFQKEQLAAVVKSIVGWDSRRDDEGGFSTMSGEFPAEMPLESAGPGMGDVALRWAPTAAQVLGLLLVLWFLKSLLKRPGGARAAAAAEAESAAPTSAEDQAKRMRREIERAIAQDPAALARMVDTWLTEQKA